MAAMYFYGIESRSLTTLSRISKLLGNSRYIALVHHLVARPFTVGATAFYKVLNLSIR